MSLVFGMTATTIQRCVKTDLATRIPWGGASASGWKGIHNSFASQGSRGHLRSTAHSILPMGRKRQKLTRERLRHGELAAFEPPKLTCNKTLQHPKQYPIQATIGLNR